MGTAQADAAPVSGARAGSGPGPETDWVGVARQLAEEFAPYAAERERRASPPLDELKKIRESGLVNLLIPARFGGLGQNWQVVTRVIVELSKADPNIGVLLAYHFHNYYPAFIDTVHWSEEIQRASAANRWLWGHITDPWAPNCFATPQPDGGFRVNGVKRINTGAPTGDVMSILVRRDDRDETLLGWLPTDRRGVRINHDWDLLGMRRTDTSSITFEDVVLGPDDILKRTKPGPYALANPYWQINASLAFGSVYVGAALGALDAARRYVLTRTDADPVTGSHPAKPDAQFVLAEFGRLWTRAQAVVAFLAKAARVYDEAFAANPDAELGELGHVKYLAEILDLSAARTGIEIGAKIFDLTGASGAARSYGFDRYWRDIRAHSLHVESPAYRERWVGAYYLTGANQGIKFSEPAQATEATEAAQKEEQS
jgi:alkylation response protein AidB-like acyl-CoA dehydrogenase